MSGPSREQQWPGYCNVRDLGGLATPWSSTGTTRFGRVFRGPRPESLTAAGWQAVLAAGVTTVVDLRNSDERFRTAEDPRVEVPAGLKVIHRPVEDLTDPEYLRRCATLLESPAYYRDQVALFGPMVGRALRAVAEARPGGVLVHCSAGRDRTGLVSALLLVLAGVGLDEVVADYVLSVRAMDVEVGAGRVRGTHHGAGLEAWVEQTRGQLLEFLAWLLPDGDPGEQGLARVDVDAATGCALRRRLTADHAG